MNAWLLQSAILQTKESILEETKEQLQQEYVVVVWGFSAGFGQTKKFLDTTAAKASNTRRNNQECIISYE